MTNELKESLSFKFKKYNNLDFAPSQIAVYNNCYSLFGNLFKRLFKENDEIIIIEPCRSACLKALNNNKINIETIDFSTIQTNNGINQFNSLIKDNTVAIYLCQTYYYDKLTFSNTTLKKIINIALEHQLIIISDELLYNRMYHKNNFCSLASVDKKIKNYVITVSGFSKEILDTGIKYCYYACSQDLIKKYKNIIYDDENINFSYEIPFQIDPENIKLDIVYEDKDIIIVDKPRGLLVHPTQYQRHNTLVNALTYHCEKNLSTIRGSLLPGVVHRIDKDTSGLLVFCKNNASHIKISKQLEKHTIQREYYTIVQGQIWNNNTINKQIAYVPQEKRYNCVSSGGKHAVTHYYVIKTFKQATLLKCVLETGRHHQIRIHLASIGHPLLGDSKYGDLLNEKFRNFDGHILHSKTLALFHPRTKKWVSFSTELPPYFKKILDTLR